jgi:alkylation response protein AidB-like acyl-CoA dehydrogenase
VTLEDVRVPKDCLIGEEGHGSKYLLINFNHERLVLSTQANREARTVFAEAFKYAMKRKTFGKRLIEHPVIRFKLAEMIRQIEAVQDNIERITYQFSKGVSDAALGAQCALLKVNATKTIEYACREASQVFGGAAVVREGQGLIVERIYREVRGYAIPGGSEEILLDFAIRNAASVAERQGSSRL